MSGYADQFTQKSGDIGDSSSDPVTWNLYNNIRGAVLVFTITCEDDTTLYVQEAESEEALASPTLSLPHKFSESISANVTKRVVLPYDPSLPFGKAWIEGGTGNYVLIGGRRANS